MKKIFYSIISVLIIALTIINVSDKVLAWGSDDDYAGNSYSYSCTNPNYPILIGNQCYPIENKNTYIERVDYVDTFQTQYSYTTICPDGSIISIYDRCPQTTYNTRTDQTQNYQTQTQYYEPRQTTQTQTQYRESWQSNQNTNWNNDFHWGLGFSWGNNSGSNWNNWNWNNKYRCWNGAYYDYSWQCPTQPTQPTTPTPTICPAGTFLSPDDNRTCVKNCSNGSVVRWNETCPVATTTTPTICPVGYFTLRNDPNKCVKICSDNTIIELGSGRTCPVATTTTPTICPAGTFLSPDDNRTCVKNCSNGSVVRWNETCPVATTTTPTICPVGYFTLRNDPNKCVKICSDNTIIELGSGRTCPVATTTTPTICPAGTFLSPEDNRTCVKNCSNGSVVRWNETCPTQPTERRCEVGIFLNGTCVRQCPDGVYKSLTEPCPVQQTTQYVCWNGQIVSAATQCIPRVEYQTCWNGQQIPVGQTCPTQYQTCWNGQQIPVGQTCPTPPVVRNHRVQTDLTTRITERSAQCNGVGLISNNRSSVGWFEYGETYLLDKFTDSGNIGSSAIAPFAQTITRLKPNTQYYCRAVIANADGTFRGEIVPFKTLPEQIIRTNTNINTPSQPKIVYVGDKGGTKGGSGSQNNITLTPKTKTEFVCSDGSIATAKTVSVANTLKSGGKLIQVSLDKDSSNLIQNTKVNYNLTIKNTADTALSGIEIKFVIPRELTFAPNLNQNNGKIENNILIIKEESLNVGEVKVYTIPLIVNDTAQEGKTIVVTGYVSYNLPIIGNRIVKDETSAYIIANISAPNKNNNISATNTSAIASGTFVSSFFPQTLVSWLILLAIILIIVVLIMNIHTWLVMRRKEKEEHIIHHHIS